MAELRLNGEMNLLSTRYRVSSDCACRFKRQKWMVEVLRETSSDIGRIGLTGEKRELLHVDELIARYEWRWRFPKWCEMIDWVQDLRRWFDRKYDKPAREALFKLIERASQSAQESLQRVAGTLSRWFEPIVRYIRHRYTNGMTEGFNNKIKLIQRMAYGLRNEHNRR